MLHSKIERIRAARARMQRIRPGRCKSNYRWARWMRLGGWKVAHVPSTRPGWLQ